VAESDAELVDRARDGDSGALERLLELHYDRIAKICRRIAAGPAEADDCTQEALIAIVKGISRFDGRSQFTTWSYRVATNACLDELRRRQRRGTPVDPDDLASVGDESVQTDSLTSPVTTSGVEARLDLDAALSQVPLEYRVPLILREVADLDYAQIAEHLGVPVGTVKSRIARGRAALAGGMNRSVF